MSDLPDIETFASDYPRGSGVAPHAHDFGQVAFARRGVMRVVARGDGGRVGDGHAETRRGGVWVVPPGRALWIPARVPHEVQCRTEVAMRTVYLRADRRLPYRDALAVLEVTPLLREVILRLVEGPVIEGPAGGGEPGGDDTRPHLVALLVAELGAAPTVPLHLPQPRDPRLERIVARLMAEPAARGTLED
ncbi:AraC family ligand binding domain-containing protein, partial [Microbaculum marinum]